MTVPTPPGRALAPNLFPPEHSEIDGLILRRPTPGDAEPFHAAITSSFSELHPWMPWCTDPIRIEDQRGFIERAATKWDSQAAFHWFIIETGTGLLGTVSLMDSVGVGGLEAGYWLRTDATGRGVMTRCVARATSLALALPGIERVEIRCDSANVRSSAVPRRLGYRLARQVSTEPAAPGECGLEQQWITP